MKKKISITSISIAIAIAIAGIIYACSCFFVPYKLHIALDDIKYYKKAYEYVYNEAKENASSKLCTTAMEKDDNIYFINPNTKILCCMNKSFEKEEVIIKEKIEGFLLRENRLYYSTINGFYYLDLNTNNTVEFEGVNPRNIQITDQYIYFLNENCVLFRADQNGKNIRQLSNDKIGLYVVKGNKIFFARYYIKTLGQFGIISAMNDDGTNQNVLIDIDIDGIYDVRNNSIYFGRKDKKLYRFNLLTQSMSQINSDDYWFNFIVTDERIYYGTNLVSSNNDMLVSNNMDGKDEIIFDKSGDFTSLSVNDDYILYKKDTNVIEAKLVRISSSKKTTLFTSEDWGIEFNSTLLDDYICLYYDSSDLDSANNEVHERKLLFYNYNGDLLYTIE